MSIQKIKKLLNRSAAETTEVELEDILSWAMYPDGGALPGRSAGAFARWLDEAWNDWTEDPETTVKDVLEGAVTAWCGGRVMPS